MYENIEPISRLNVKFNKQNCVELIAIELKLEVDAFRIQDKINIDLISGNIV